MTPGLIESPAAGHEINRTQTDTRLQDRTQYSTMCIACSHILYVYTV